jgi:hypothetical protein
MTSDEFVAACHRAGVTAIPWRVFDGTVAKMLEVEESTVRRWRIGRTPVPGPVRVALRLMGRPAS